MNAFATAMNVIFADGNMAVEAIWFAGGTGPGVAVRVIRKSPDEITPGPVPPANQMASTVMLASPKITFMAVAKAFMSLSVNFHAKVSRLFHREVSHL